MPCNIAFSIAKAAVSEEKLRALLTAAAIKDIVLKYLKRQYTSLSPTLIDASGNAVRYRLGTLTLSIVDGVVRVDGPRARATSAEQLVASVSRLLSQLAGRLFQAKVQEALRDVTLLAQTDTVRGTRQKAAVFTIRL